MFIKHTKKAFLNKKELTNFYKQTNNSFANTGLRRKRKFNNKKQTKMRAVLSEFLRFLPETKQKGPWTLHRQWKCEHV